MQEGGDIDVRRLWGRTPGGVGPAALPGPPAAEPDDARLRRSLTTPTGGGCRAAAGGAGRRCGVAAATEPSPSAEGVGAGKLKSILILFEISFFISGVVTEIIFCFVFKLLIVAYVVFAVDVNI